jgi:hypothetical protein
MKRQKYEHNKEISIKSNIIFCAECGEALDQFGISGSEIDMQKIKERHKHCKETGKFKGDKCAMIFIAEETEPTLPQEDDE